MAQMICRMYATRRRAILAADELRLNGYGIVDVFGNTEDSTLAEEEHVALMRRVGIPRTNLGAYARRIGEGGTLIAVEAHFGRALMAERILDGHGPVDMGETPREREPTFDDRTPMSSIMGLPALAERALPFEGWTGMPSLARNWFFSGLFGLPYGRSKAAPFSSALGLPTLSRGATPLSSMTGMATLSANPTPLSSALGLPVLKSGTILT
jgi:hypothetical protein